MADITFNSTLQGVQCLEWIGSTGFPQSPMEQGTDGEIRITRRFIVDWVDRRQAVSKWMGWSCVKTLSGTNYVSRNVPLSCFEWGVDPPGGSIDTRLAGQKYVHATGYAIQPMEQDEDRPTGRERMWNDAIGYPVYKHALMTVNFESLPYDVLTDEEMIAAGYSNSGAPDESTCRRWVTITEHPLVKYLTPQGGQMYYAGTSTPVSPAPGKVQVMSDRQVRWWGVSEYGVPIRALNPTLRASATDGAVESKLGRVNSDVFAFAAASTLLFVGVEAEPMRLAWGGRGYNVTYHFSYFDQTHNKVPRIDTGSTTLTYTQAVLPATHAAYDPDNTTTGVRIFDPVPFAPLMRAP